MEVQANILPKVPQGMHQLFVDRLLPEGELLELTGDERHYLGRVLRARPGESFRLAALDGFAATAVLESVGADSALLRVGPSDPDPAESLRIALDLCPPRGDALDLALEMAAQLGVVRLRLVRSQRTLAEVGKGGLREDRLLKRLREACRQCLRVRLPVLEKPVSFAEAIRNSGGPRSLLMSERGGEPLPSLAGGDAEIRVLVGPEGGFAVEELDAARAGQWRLVTLGSHPLKTATAVAAALAGLLALRARPPAGEP